MVNGPEAFTPDNEFCLGETEVDGFFVAAGFCAHGIAGAGGIGRLMAEWVVDGEPGMDVWHMDIRRFGPHYRSPSYTLARTRGELPDLLRHHLPGARALGRPAAAHLAGLRLAPGRTAPSFGEKAGWERVNYYASNAAAGDESLRPRGWAGRHWSPATGAEHLGTRAAAGLFDESSFAKIEVSGAGRGRVPGVGLRQPRRPRRRRGHLHPGAQLRAAASRPTSPSPAPAEDAFLVVTGTAFGAHDLDWLRRQARRREADVRIADVTGQYACYALWGPRSRDILAALTPGRPVQRGVPVPDRAGRSPSATCRCGRCG